MCSIEQALNPFGSKKDSKKAPPLAPGFIASYLIGQRKRGDAGPPPPPAPAAIFGPRIGGEAKVGTSDLKNIQIPR